MRPIGDGTLKTMPASVETENSAGYAKTVTSTIPTTMPANVEIESKTGTATHATATTLRTMPANADSREDDP